MEILPAAIQIKDRYGPLYNVHLTGENCVPVLLLMGAPPAATTAWGAVNPVGASLCFRAGVAQGSLGKCCVICDTPPHSPGKHLPKIVRGVVIGQTT